MAHLISVNTNDQNHFHKLPRPEALLVADFGLEGDRHAGRPLRQVSLLNVETVRDLANRAIPVEPGTLGENLTIEGIDLMALPVGAHLNIGSEAQLEITGERPACKEMLAIHKDALRLMVGHSGRMARVVRGGMIRPRDLVTLA